MQPLSNFDDVGDFHHKFDLTSVNHEGAGPREVTEELFEFRKKFLYEELDEFIEGWEEQDFVKMFDSLLDLVYVAMGTAHLFGFPWQEGWDAVQAANMSKVRAAKDGSDSKRGSSFDVVKPEGWQAPDELIAQFLRQKGFIVDAEEKTA